MEKRFNGQINISRDLRKNKQTVIGKYDLIDVIFLSIGFGIAFVVSYTLGFSPFHITDEFSAIIISLFPLLIVVWLGFKRTAGIRQFNYILMKNIDKKSRTRFNRIKDKTQVGEKYIVGFEIEEGQVDKSIDRFFSYMNLSQLSIRYVKDYITNEDKIYILIGMRYNKNDDILADLIDKFYKNNELKTLTYEQLSELEEDHRLKFIEIVDNHKSVFNSIKETISSYMHKWFSKHTGIRSRFSSIVNKYFGEYIFKKKQEKNIKEIKQMRYQDRSFIIYMLNIYDSDKYNEFITEAKRYADVISYYKLVDRVKYVNTFLIIEDDKEISNIKTIEKLCEEKGVVLDRLVNEQAAARNATSYMMTNPFNAYRVFI